ncbi:methyltransferase family protein [Pseudacidobacterium ailaaui]|jgi:protein-S-isoprenylcysteine O-methyltransferase|uniref:methyltransferase family protein n=1 Tax=Pseudacidobacterium ailaaui TaxID=1382359 RepID=UPI0004796702|nr:isoprenylcysteine carboxylmethyltransferase family protein [Pseudacidobacterium ailaaui]MBX6358569.1 isoprenylcysteine carboxylmethyltransferase family protein [Pseudacidobacterium ailaaui]MCL6464363.1 isoprenylcysteine carboxylmethyltransferase family protein [Pseudacidobacterium ailaaui]MDI3256030.1 isoprenylcysteine carboxylmethyltransferase family protein [Bacillota bacterium]
MSYSVETLRHATSYLWILLCAVWLLTSLGTKRTVQRQSSMSRFWQLSILALGCFLVFFHGPTRAWLDVHLFPVTPRMAMAGFLLAAIGVGFSIWARLVLGGNWSGVATIKEGHTLVRKGPYSIVRHPIYTGLLLAILGCALQRGLLRGLLGVILVGFGFWLKVTMEEWLMVQRFGEEYIRYRQQVRALVPFLF